MQPPSWIGHSLSGRYHIEDELGAGGMSAVYKAQDPNLRRVVAIKLIHAHLSSDPEFVRRFEAEAAVVAQLRHNNIVQVYDFNHDGDTYYIVFEFVPGETLQSRIKRYNDAERKMPAKEVMHVAKGVAKALIYAHERDIVHRDIKPANVMINVHGDAILTDFGIVKIVGGTQHTATGAVMGTARYMSPEQIRGQKVDARTDIYAFGIMLYEMLGGRAPFSSESAMTLMMMHVNDPVPDIRNLRPGVPPALVQIIERALAKDPLQRYQTMADLLADLERAEAGRPLPAAGAAANMTMLDVEEENAAGTEMLSEYVAPATGAAARPSSQQFEAAPLGPPPPATPATSSGGINKTVLGIIGGLLLVVILVGGLFAILGGGEGEDAEATAAAIAAADEDDDGDEEEDTGDDEEETAVPAEDESEPTAAPTEEPTAVPVEEPTAAPTATTAPTAVPTAVPTLAPTATTAPPTATTAPPTPTSAPWCSGS